MIRVFTILFCFLLPMLATAQNEYKGAEIYSLQAWKYGKVDIRMKMAKGSGILSTFFTYKNGSEISGTFWEEIDIEVFGKDNAETMQTNIITGDPKTYSEEIHSPGFSMGDNYHTYTIEWTPDYVAWYIDGVEMRRSEGEQVAELTNPQSFRMNIWAAEWEDWVGPFDTDALPAYQFVNWIQYASYTPGEGDNNTDFTAAWRDDFNSFNSSRWGRADWTFEGNLVQFDPNNVVIKDGYLVLAISHASETGFAGSVPQDGDVTSVYDEIIEGNIKIFPNPTMSQVNIQGDFRGQWSLLNSFGEELMQGKGKHVNLDNYPNGIYFLHVDDKVLKVIKN